MRVALINTSALLLSIGIGVWSVGRPRAETSPIRAGVDLESTLETTVDTTGEAIRNAPYRRIASVSTVADQVLFELIDSSRIVAVSRYSKEHGQKPWRYNAKQEVSSVGDLERLLSLRPDIIFSSNFADARHVERLREAGLVVFDLGPTHGLSTLVPNILSISAVLQVPERGKKFARAFERRMETVSSKLEPKDRKSGLYVALHVGQLYGGTKGTSFADILRAAGLVDVADRAGHSGWPSYSSEALLAMDPAWVITHEGDAERICEQPGLSNLSACSDGQIIEVNADLVGDPALGMLEASEVVHRALYSNDRSAATTGR